MKRVKDELCAAFRVVDMGQILFYLELKVDRDKENKDNETAPASLHRENASQISSS